MYSFFMGLINDNEFISDSENYMDIDLGVCIRHYVLLTFSLCHSYGVYVLCYVL
jgi:hypothetical protein